MNIAQTQFFYLLRAGLWGKVCQSDICSDVDWSSVVKLASSQTVLGLVIDGMDHVIKSGESISKPSEMGMNKLLMDLFLIENSNRHLNTFIPKLNKMLEGVDYYMVKGQVVAQSYLNPLHRQAGDIDLLLDDENYQKARAILIERADKLEPEDVENHHFAAYFADIEVELHGPEKMFHRKKLYDRTKKWTWERIGNQNTKVRINGVEISAGSYNFNAIYIFTHFFKHFLSSGVSFRQISDWVRYLYLNKDNIDRKQLEEDLVYLDLLDVWNVFSYIGVDYLGCPEDAMPLYDSTCVNRSRKAVDVIFEGGNFGNYAYKRLNSDNYFIRKCNSLFIHFAHAFKLFSIFPRWTFRNITSKLYLGVRQVFRDFVKTSNNDKV